MIVAAFEAWVNEAAHGCTVSGVRTEDLVDLLHGPLAKRYHEIPTLVSKARLPQNDNLLAVIDVRDEIVHDVPRAITGEGNVPGWMRRLHRMGLFVSSKRAPKSDLLLSQKLPSYRLAYWCCEVIDSAAKTFVAALGNPALTAVAVSAANLLPSFSFYSKYSPRNFGEFDRLYCLTLTDG